MRRIIFMMWKEVLELRQDPRIFSIIFIAPIVQLTVLGYAATTDVRNVPIVIVDADRSAAQPGARSAVSAPSGTFTIVDVVSSIEDVDPYLEGGRAWMALSIPPRYGESVATGRPASLQIVADGSDASSTNIAMGYASNLIAGYAQDLVEQTARSGRGRVAQDVGRSGIEPRVRVWFNPTLESRYFMLPGIFALLLLVVTSNLSSMAIVREREVGTLEQLNVTPLGRVQLIVGKLLPVRRDRADRRDDRAAGHRVLVRGAAARQLLAARRDELRLPADDARPGPVRLDDLEHAAAGDDDLDVLLPDADDVPLGLRLSDREHARSAFSRSRT